MTTPEVTRATRITVTVGGVVFAVGCVFAAGAWASAVESKVGNISNSVDRIESQIDKLADFNTRIAVIEAAIVDLRQQRREP